MMLSLLSAYYFLQQLLLHTVSNVNVCLQLLLSSDEGAFGGFENLSKKYNTEYSSSEGDYDGRPHSIKVKTCQVCVNSI